MKYLIVFFFLPFSLFSQATLEPIKKSNRVIIETTDDPEIAFQKLSKIFLLKGYNFKMADKDLWMIQTEKRKMGKFMFYNTRLKGMIEQNGELTQIKLFGEFSADAKIDWGDGTNMDMNEHYNEINFLGMKSSFNKKGFQDLIDIAKDYQSGSIKYLKE